MLSEKRGFLFMFGMERYQMCIVYFQKNKIIRVTRMTIFSVSIFQSESASKLRFEAKYHQRPRLKKASEGFERMFNFEKKPSRNMKSYELFSNTMEN